LAVERTAAPAGIGFWRKAFSFPVTIAGLLATLAVVTVRSRFDDPDMWWHLKMGQIIWTGHTIPATDLFSYTTHHHAWIPHEWLSQILIYGAYRFGGYSGLMLWLCFFSAALLIAGYALCSLYSGNAKVGFVGALAVWFFATMGFAVRPQMIGYLLLVIELLLLHLGHTRSPRWFFLLPPLFAIWVNSHGSFFLGFAVAGISFACSFFDFERGSLASSRSDPRDRRTLGVSLLLSAAALLLNPVGVRQILYPLDTLANQNIQLNNVAEWMPLQMNSARGVGVLGVLACIFLLIITTRRALFLNELLLLALGTWLAVSHERMVFVFGILAAPVLSRLLSTSWDNYRAEQDRVLPNVALLAISLLVAFWGFPNPRNLGAQVEEKSPVKAVEFIKTHHLSGNMLNEYVYGGYLIWAAPEHPVFVDGRGDVFEWTGVLADFGRWATLQSDPNELLDKYRISFCILARTSPMAQVFKLMPGWKTVYSDNLSVIVTRAAAGS
jgi:hypothetical protein